MGNFVTYLENLNLREKIFFAILMGILGIFLALKFYENFFEHFVEEIASLNVENLQEKKAQINDLMRRKNDLKIEIDAQNLSLRNHQKSLMIFAKNYEDYLDFIELLSKKYGLILKNLQNSYEDGDFFQRHRLNLELNGEFSELLFFIQELENSHLVFVFESIKFQNTKSLALSLHLNLQFVVLK